MFFNWKCQDAEIKTLHRNKPGKFSYSESNFHQNRRQTYGGHGGPSFSSLLCLTEKKAGKRLNNDILGSPDVCSNFPKAVKILGAPQRGKRPFSLFSLPGRCSASYAKTPQRKFILRFCFILRGNFLMYSSIFLLRHNFIPLVIVHVDCKQQTFNFTSLNWTAEQKYGNHIVKYGN